MKKKIKAFFALLLLLCFTASSCGADVSALENLCFAVRDFDLERAEKYTGEDKEGYFGGVLSLAEGLSAEKKETAKAIYSAMTFSKAVEEDGVCTVTVRYVDFKGLTEAVEFEVNTGASATESLREIIESGRLQKQFMKTAADVKVTLSKNENGAFVELGYAGENAELTRIFGLDTFLRWYAMQR